MAVPKVDSSLFPADHRAGRSSFKRNNKMKKLRPDTIHDIKLKYKNLNELGLLSPSFWEGIAPFLRWLIDEKGFDSHQIVSVVEEPYNYFELRIEFIEGIRESEEG